MNRVVLLTSLAFSLALAVVVHAQDKKPDDKGKPEPKTIIIQIDASKLPPELLKRLLELSSNPKAEAKSEDKKPEGKPLPPGLAKKVDPKGEPEKKPATKDAVKSIGLADAIAIAEKTAQGIAVEAERKGEGSDVRFEVVVVGKDGKKHEVQMDASGKVRPSEEKKDDNKDKKKEDDDKKKGDNKEAEKKPTEKKKDD